MSMREPTYFILAALLRGPRHGYAVIKLVEEMSAGTVRLATGTLYATVERLHGAGLVKVVKQEVINGRSRRYFALTEAGEVAVQQEAARMAAAAQVVMGQSWGAQSGIIARTTYGLPGAAPA